MIFDYDLYYRVNLVSPIRGILFMLFAFILVRKELFKGIQMIINYFRFKEKPNVSKLVSSILMIGIILFYSIMHFEHLLNGGIYLISEKEQDYVAAYGLIEDIEHLGVNSGQHYILDHVTTSGIIMTIDGVEYTAMSRENLSVGDYVYFEYLPKSGFILKIEEQYQ